MNKSLAIVAGLLLASPALGALTSVNTVDVGTKTELVNLTLSNNRSFDVADITNVEIFHYFRTNSGSGNSTTILSSDNAAILNALNKSVLLSDTALNTGAGINPGRAVGSNTGLPVGTSPTASTPGLGVRFTQSVVNGPGEDIVLFEFASDGVQAMDPWVITALSGGVSYSGVSTGSAFVTTPELSGNVQANQAFTQLNPVASLNDLDTKTVSNSTVFANPRYHGVAIDLSALGIPLGGTVDGLFIQSQVSGGEVDPVFIGGLQNSGLVGYTGTGASGLEELVSVDVMTKGVTKTIAAEDLIGGQVTHFKGGATNNIAQRDGGGAPAPGSRATMLEDNRLDTGLINPGFSATALTSDPIIDPFNPANSTPGLAFEFNRPLINGEGIDVIVFEIQNSSGAASGDPFHVSPLTGLGSGLNSITISQYDIQFSDAQEVSNFDQFVFSPGSPQSLLELESFILNAGTSNNPGFRLVATGIDLSWLGYEEGALVSGLFFQSANSGALFDPMFIAGIDQSIPEPASALLLVTAVGGLMLRRRRQQDMI